MYRLNNGLLVKCFAMTGKTVRKGW